KRKRGLEHDRYTVPRHDAPPFQPVGEAGREFSDRGEADLFVAPVRMSDPNRDPTRRRMTGYAFMRDVEAVAIAVEQGPQLLHRKQALRVVVARYFGKFRHRPFGRCSRGCRRVTPPKNRVVNTLCSL